MLISVIIPVYNDQEVLSELVKRLYPVLEAMDLDNEVIFIDDCSCDGSLNELLLIQKERKNTVILKLQKNCGQLKAIRAGLDNCEGELIVIMDSDLQDRPEDIPVLFREMLLKDADMAVARRRSGKDLSFRRIMSSIFFTISNLITGIKVPVQLGVFRVMNKDVLEKIKKFPVHNYSELGYLYKIKVKYTAVDLERDQRHSGTSGYDLKKLVKLGLARLALNPFINFLLNIKKPSDRGYIIDKKYVGQHEG